KKASRGLSYLLSYTWSKTIDIGGAIGAGAKPLIGADVDGLRPRVGKKIREPARCLLVQRDMQTVVPGFADAFVVVDRHEVGNAETSLSRDEVGRARRCVAAHRGNQ